MSEEAQEIAVHLKPIPNKPDINIKLYINSNATVLQLEEIFKDALSNIEDFAGVSVGILKFMGRELDDKNKTLNEFGIGDLSEIENENGVSIETINGQTIYITCDQNTTVREFLKKLKGKNLGSNYIRLIYAGVALERSTLDQKLLGPQVSIEYGTTLHLVFAPETDKNIDTVFNLNNLDESKNSNYPLLRIIVGIATLLFLVAAITTFCLFFLTSLSFSIAVPIVLTVLFVAGAVLFFGWNKILPKILPEGCLKKINSGIDPSENDRDKSKNYETEEKVPDKTNEYGDKI